MKGREGHGADGPSYSVSTMIASHEPQIFSLKLSSYCPDAHTGEGGRGNTQDPTRIYSTHPKTVRGCVSRVPPPLLFFHSLTLMYIESSLSSPLDNSIPPFYAPSP